MHVQVKIALDELTGVALGYIGSVCAMMLTEEVYHFVMHGFFVPILGGIVSWLTVRLLKKYFPDHKPIFKPKSDEKDPSGKAR